MTENMTPEEVVAAALALGPDGDGTDPSDWSGSAAHVVASLRDASLLRDPATLTHSHTCVTVPTASELAELMRREGKPYLPGQWADRSYAERAAGAIHARLSEGHA